MTYPPAPPPPGNFPPSDPGQGYPGQGYAAPTGPAAAYPPAPPGYYPPPGYAPPPGGYYPAGPAMGLPKSAYTPWITRVAATLIDSAIYGAIMSVGLFTLEFSTSETSPPSALAFTVYIMAMLAALAFIVWNYGYRQGTTGSTIGKSVMKFKVVAESTGQPIGFGRSVLRQLAHVLDGLSCYVGYLFPLWDAKRQTFADKIMSTVCLPR